MPAADTPNKRRHERTRQEILAAAREIILTQGVDNLSMRGLAEKVDYTPAALYKYFSSKEDLVEEIRREGWDLMRDFYREHIPPQDSLPERLYAAALAYQAFADQYPAHYLLMFESSQAAPQSMEALYADPNFVGLLKLIERGTATGELALPAGFTPLLLRLQFWVMSHGMAMLKLTTLKNVSGEMDAIFRQLVRATIDTLKPDHPLD